jgi:flagellar hook-length control protein FliK
MRLDPPELGTSRVDMRMHDRVVTLHIETQTPAGQVALKSNLEDLRAALERHGIQIDRVDVELRPPAAPPQPEWREPREDGQGQPDRQGRGSDGAPRDREQQSPFDGTKQNDQAEPWSQQERPWRPSEMGVDLEA